MKTINLFSTHFAKTSFSLLLFLIFAGFSFHSQAQNNGKYQTLFSKNDSTKPRISGFISVINELSVPNGGRIGTFYSVGGELALLLNQRFYIGGYSLTSLAPFDLEKNYLDQHNMNFIQIGGVVGYKINPNKPIHFNVSTKVGYAGLHWFQWDEWDFNHLTQRNEGWMFAPHVNVEVNFFPWMQAYAGLGYRWVWGDERYGFNLRKDLSQATVQLGVSFGWFR